MSDPAPIKTQAERAASLSHAAECLARAAAKLSEAARAMSTVAGALSQGNAAKDPAANGFGIKLPPVAQPDTAPSSQITAPEDDGAGLPQPHRLLLDDEADILLILCSLIYDRPKVVCYFACGTPTLKLYKGLIDSVAETNAIIPDSESKSSISSCYKKFLKEKRSLILLSETDIPGDPAKEVSEYTVIHVGWPVSKNQYVAQRRTHQASTNILLAYSGDKDLYPSGSAIMSQTEVWPGDTGGFRASADILRPLFEERLSELSFEMKEEAYLDWIHLHSRQGSRPVSSWTPSALVSRANRFILGPLAYRSPGSLTKRTTLQTPLVDLIPEVTAEFVTQHGLQPAVDEGLLRVESEAEVVDVHETGPNSASRWSAEDTRPRIVPEDSPTHPLHYQNNIEGHGVKKQTNSVRPTYSTNAPPEAPGSFELATGQTYFALDEEFDAIPLICFLTSKFKKIIIFLDGAMLQRYRDLFRQLMRQQVLMLKPSGPAQTIEEVSLQFVASQTPVTLLVEHTANDLPFALKHYTIGCWIYWVHDFQIEIAKRFQSQIKCALAALLIPSSRREKLVAGMSGFREHPQTAMILARGSQSLIESERQLVRSTLLLGGRIIQGLYSTRIASLRGDSQQGTRSAEEIVHLANQYAARVLLHGVPEDGSAVFPPIAGRPSVERGVADILRLQPAIYGGLLYVN